MNAKKLLRTDLTNYGGKIMLAVLLLSFNNHNNTVNIVINTNLVLKHIENKLE
jgi:hypothetical protein